MSAKSEERLILDMMTRYCDIISPEYPDVRKLREVLTKLSDEQKLDILQQLHLYTITTPLHCAAYRDHAEIITTLLMSLQTEDRLLQLLADKCSTPLHTASERGNTESVKHLLDCLTPDQQIHLFSVQDLQGTTAIRIAESNMHTDIATVLTKYEANARKCQKKCQIRHQTVDKRKINKETAKPKTPGRLSGWRHKLANFLRRRGEYQRNMPEPEATGNVVLTTLVTSLVPSKYEEIYHCDTGKHGLILYNPSDRDGAVKEADNLESGLQAVGCQVIRSEWTTKTAIYSFIKDGARRAAQGSLLIVCIMSHGSAGTLSSEDGDGCVFINDLIARLTGRLPEDLPLVILLSSCQTTTHGHYGRCPQVYTHIVLNRPHTVLLLASMRGGLAYRGAYTDAFAEELRNANGSDIADVHQRAVVKMIELRGDNQTPEMRSTLKKKLVLTSQREDGTEWGVIFKRNQRDMQTAF